MSLGRATALRLSWLRCGSKVLWGSSIPSIAVTKRACKDSSQSSPSPEASPGTRSQRSSNLDLLTSTSHINAETPGSIHEGGELGYALAVAFGAIMDKPDLIVTCIVGDGEAETGPTAT